MSPNRWLQDLRSALAPDRGQRRHRRLGSLRAAKHRRGFEALEDRLLLTFVPITALPVELDSYELYPADVAAGDFNNDSRIDLVTGNLADTVSVFLGKGDGTFQPGTSSFVFPSPLSLALGDFNADGNLDLATALYDVERYGNSDVGILLGDGDGTFADPVYLSFLSEATSMTSIPDLIATDDMNGDNKLDLVLTSWDTVTGEEQLSVLLGDGDGNFTFVATYAQFHGGHSAPVLADIDSDGNVDVVVTDWSTSSLQLLLGNGDGTLSAPSSISTDSVSSVVADDFNADGKVDLAALDDFTGNVSVLLGNGDGTFQTGQTSAAGVLPILAATGEFNGDGVPDLFVTDGLGGASVLLGHGDGRFAQPITTDAGTSSASVVVDDFNADGRSDAAMADFDSSSVLVKLNDGNWPDPNAPQVLIDDVTFAEGNSGTTDAVFTVILSEPSSDTVTVDYATASGTALAGSDFVAMSGTLTFAPGETGKTVAIPVLGDTVFEPDESFVVNLTGAGGATIVDGQGVGTIQNDDVAPLLTINDVSGFEGRNGVRSFVFTVSLSEASGQWVYVDFATADGTATAGEDYVAQSGTLSFAPGETTKTITVAIRGDKTKESDEHLYVNLFGAIGGQIADSQGVATILNDDRGESRSKRTSFASAVDAAIDDWMLYGG